MWARLSGWTIIETLQTWVKDVGDERVDTADVNQHLIAALNAGDISGALQRFDELAATSDVWSAEELANVNESTIILWGRIDGRWVATLFTLDSADHLVMVMARLPEGRKQVEVRALLIEFAQQLAENEQ